MSSTSPRPAPPLKGMWHIALQVRDLAAMRHFYVDLLGYEVEWEPDADNLYLTRGRDNVALHRSEGEVVAGGALDHLGFVVDSPEHVDAWEAHLRAAGTPPAVPIKTHRDGARSFYVRDPEGILLQFIYHPPLAGR